jgi:predicted SnoaL-like aldol condensation-catalyzing enzyme
MKNLLAAVAVVAALGVGYVAGGGLAQKEIPAAPPVTAGKEEANKQLVLAFEDLTFEKKDVNAAAQLLADNFIQHNPQVPDGREGFIGGVGGYLLASNPNLMKETRRVVAEEDFVVVHAFAKFDGTNPEERGVAVIDIFRVANSKIAEHWDVIQEIPESLAHTNGMF